MNVLADTSQDINAIYNLCFKIAGDFEKLTAAEQADESANSKRTELGKQFEINCTAGRAGVVPNCAKLAPEQCVKEPLKCLMVGSTCTQLKTDQQTKNKSPCIDRTDAQGALCSSYKTHTTSFGVCGCSKKGGCGLICSKLNEAACATETNTCNWNGSECAQRPAEGA